MSNYFIIRNKVTKFVYEYMKKYDPSHNFEHVNRVRNMALHIAKKENIVDTEKLFLIEIAALLHDVADHKYKEKHENRNTIIVNLLVNTDLSHDFIKAVIMIVENVSYSNELKIGPNKMKEILTNYPELAYVQDSDRLDSIGAHGIYRCIVYSITQNKPIESVMSHFDEKLLLIKELMKTNTGKNIAIERTKILEDYKQAYLNEL